MAEIIYKDESCKINGVCMRGFTKVVSGFSESVCYLEPERGLKDAVYV